MKNGGCEKPLEGVSAKMSAFTTTLGRLLDQLVAEELTQWQEGVQERLEGTQAAVRKMAARILAPKAEMQYNGYVLEELFSYATVAQRVVWSTGEVSIPAGESVTITACYPKKPSYDFACTADAGRQDLRGWDLGTRLGSNLAFGKITARLENCQHLELAGQNFGFELAKGVTQVELEPETDYYYMEVRLKEES